MRNALILLACLLPLAAPATTRITRQRLSVTRGVTTQAAPVSDFDALLAYFGL
jgi:hypothetical protein